MVTRGLSWRIETDDSYWEKESNWVLPPDKKEIKKTVKKFVLDHNKEVKKRNKRRRQKEKELRGIYGV